jgi:hypothetical protein
MRPTCHPNSKGRDAPFLSILIAKLLAALIEAVQISLHSIAIYL